VISPDPAAIAWSLIVFTRWPVAGQTKTRLIPSYGAEGAASIHRQLIARTVAVAQMLPPKTNVVVAIAEAPQGVDTSSVFPATWPRLTQRGVDLGERMAHAIDDAFRLDSAAQSMVLIGVDCPDYSSALLLQAAAALQSNDIVFAPTEDGGYGLVGVQRCRWHLQTRRALFKNIAWGTSSVMRATLDRLKTIAPELTVAMLPTIWDIDTKEDVERAIALGTLRL
jgi:uncharacterized protein